jgi:N6-L-threonylcarbamoyladenine synthase
LPLSQIKIHQKRHGAETEENYDFSFSGIKTAVLRFVEKQGMNHSIEERRLALAGIQEPKAEQYLEQVDQLTLDLIASFQQAVVQDLVRKTLRAAEQFEVESLIVTGGVASNRRLRDEFTSRAQSEGLEVFFPGRGLSTDNAAMIAAAAFPKFEAVDFADLHVSAEASLALGTR